MIMQWQFKHKWLINAYTPPAVTQIYVWKQKQVPFETLKKNDLLEHSLFCFVLFIFKQETGSRVRSVEPRAQRSRADALARAPRLINAYPPPAVTQIFV